MEWEENQVKHRQNLFCMSLKSCFLAKITKYQNILRKQVHVGDCFELDVTQPSEDEIELVLGRTHASLKRRFDVRKLGRQLGSAKLFQWILTLIQRVKARHVLAHLTDISDVGIKTTILDVAREVAISFEYQLMVLYGDEEVVKLARHAVTCLMAYLNQQDARFTPACLLQALIEIKPKCGNKKEIVRTQPILWNNEPVCLKWKLHHVFKQPGLRIMTARTNEPKHITHAISSGEHKTQQEKHGDTYQDDTDHKMAVREGYDEIDGYKFETVQALSKCTKSTSSLSHFIGLQSVSAAIRGELKGSNRGGLVDDSDEKTERRISALDMDFDEGMLRINDYTVEINEDFSPVNTVEINDDFSPVNETDQDFSPLFDERDTNETAEHERFMKTEEDELDKSCTDKMFELKDTTDSSITVIQNNEKLLHDISMFTPEGPKNISHNNEKLSHEVSLSHNNEKLLHNISVCTPAETKNITSDSFQKDLFQKDLFHENFTSPCSHGTNPTSLNKNAYHSRESSIDTCISNYLDCQVRKPNVANDTKETKRGGKEQSENEFRNGVVSKTGLSKREKNGAEKCYKFYGCFTPFGAKCQPSIYGFRGPLHVWDDNEKKYTLIYDDKVTTNISHCREINDRNCVHQLYQPKTWCFH